jgi:hypothetical protein
LRDWRLRETGEGLEKMRRYILIFFALLEIYIYSRCGIDGEVEGEPFEFVAGKFRRCA